MLNLFKKREAMQEKDEREKYMDYISRLALPGIKDGELVFANSLQRLFTIKDAKHYHIEAAECFRVLLEDLTAKKLCHLDERCRSYLEYHWNCREEINWKQDRLNREELSYLSEEQYVAALSFGTFHRDGYCRQACVEALKEWKDSLPYLVLRLNDWVQAVRDSAYNSILYRISVCEITELFSALPVLDKVRNSGRWERPQVADIEQNIKQQLRKKMKDCNLWEIPQYEISVRNALYRFVSQNEVLELSQLEYLLALEKSSFGKRLLMTAILWQFTVTPEMLIRYMEDKSSAVRYLAMEQYYSTHQNAWNGLEWMLLDKAKKIRDYAAYILGKHGNFDVLGFYKEQIRNGKERVALLGIGENGTGKELDMIASYLENSDDHIKRTALIAYGMLAGESGDRVYLEFLQKPEPLLYVQAYRLIVKYGVSYGSKCIFELYRKYRGLPVVDYMIRLLTRERSWERLPYLLQLCDDENLSERMKGHVLYAIQHRSMYGSVTQNEAEVIRQRLDEKRDYLSDKIVDSVLWDMKFVTR